MITVNDRTIKVSVRNFVEFLLRSGDIDNRRGGTEKDAMQAGTRIHRKIQRQMGSNYEAEVSMKYEIEQDGFFFCLEGRADGIQVDEEKNSVLIDEIKGVYRSLDTIIEPIFVHQAQAMCYGHIYCQQNQVKEITIQLTYCNLESEEIKRFQTVFGAKELEEWFLGLLKEYLLWGRLVTEARKRRNDSISPLQFPFPYRKGQRDMAVSVYKTIRRNKKLFIQAPTGVGKTMSTLFPSIKAMGEGLAEKIFYVTAKTITRTVAHQSIEILKEKGVKLLVVVLTAKEKICPMEEVNCNPMDCPYARGHFNRINEALYQMLSEETDIGRENLLLYGERFLVCPFELGLDASSFADVVIGDYNYVFDPNAHLRRFFSERGNGDYLFLIDEAHNLVERARGMYSAILYREEFFFVKSFIKKTYKKVHRLLNRCINTMDLWEEEWKHNRQNPHGILSNLGSFYENVLRLFGEMELVLEEEVDSSQRKEIVNFYLNLRHFLNIHELLDSSYEIYTGYEEEKRFFVKLFCITPANNLKQYLDKGISTIFFSATMLPIQYYREMLSNEEEDYAIYIPSPFDQENKLLAVGYDVTSRYTRRSYEEYEKIIWYLDQIMDSKKGNYMVFFPSYQYMEHVYEIAMERGLFYKARILLQQGEMTEAQKEEFLKEFDKEEKKSLLAFCVLGGIFSEGIDLTNERLIGAVIVGTGIPKVCQERELLKEHYDEQGYNGFDYAYRYPAMNKVLQSAGRVIRTPQDKGVILLLDDRFLQTKYQELFPREWDLYYKVTVHTVKGCFEEFWKKS